MAKNSHLEIFQGGDFSEFAERLTFHFLASDIGKVPPSAKLEEKQAAIKKQAAVLVTHLSPSVYSVLKSLCLPESPIDKSFSELSDLLKNYYKPNVSTVSATYSFQQCRQQDLSVVDFANKLKRLAEPCKFDAHYDRALRDQFISGIRCLETRKEILALPESKGKTFADVYKLALAKETAKKAADQISSSVVDDQSRSAAAPVHGVRQKFRRDRPSGRGSAEARSSSQQTSRKPCYRCDRHGHSPAECFYKQAKCHFCGEKGHVVKACRRKRRTTTNYVEAQSDQPGECQLPIFNVNVNNASTTTHKPYLTNVNVNGANIQFEIDTGSAVTLMSESDFMHCNVPRSELSPPSVILMGYGNNEIQCLGEIDLPISLGEKTCQTIVRVTTARNSLLGRDVMSKIRLPWEKIFSVGSPSTSTGTDFVKKYPDLFDCSKVGKVKGVQVKLQVSDENPVYQKARPVPLAIREKYVDALNKLEQEGIIEKVKTSEWASPTVPVIKPDGSLRICADYSATINKHSPCEQYPLPSLEELLTKVGQGKKYTKLDLSQAYHQLELHPDSRKYTTINTIQGLYQYKRLPFGIHSAVAIFQRVMEEELNECPGSGAFIDDVICTGENDEVHEQNVDRVLHQLNERGFKLKPQKFVYMADKITYRGHEITANGVSPSPDKVNSLKEATPPSNVSELQSFLGSANFLRKFVPKFAEIAAPLYDLLKKGNQWKWGPAENEAFVRLKNNICEESMLAHYDLNKPTILQVDASGLGLGAVLLQVNESGEARPIAFMSRKLTPTECRYAQIEREALAVVFGVTKFRQYLMGRKFVVKTDHRPLVKLLGCNEPIPSLASTRIKKWAMMLAAYDYQIEYFAGKDNVYADFLSRQALTNVPPSDSEKVTVQVLLVESGEIVRAETVRKETANDPILAQVLRFVRNDWPMEVSEELKPFYSRRTELTIEDEILLWNERVVIPMSLRLILLNDLHAEHFGMTKMKQMARRYLWWPKIDHDIECTVKSCARCQEQAKNPAKKTGTWTWSNGPWKRLHIDFAGPFMGKMFLVVVDAYSKYLDVVPMDHATSATTIKALRHIFSIFGLPEHIVTDNGSQFSSQEFKNWLTQNGIIHTLTAPGHPATNGLAERYVGLFKSKMKEFGQTGESIQERIDRFLLAYRTTPTSIGRSPSELLTNRQPRIRYNALRASTTKQQVRVFEDSSKETPSYQVGDAVFALNFGRGPRWSAGTVLHINSPFSYDIQVEGNLVWKRHRDQLRQRTIAATDYSSGSTKGTRRERADHRLRSQSSRLRKSRTAQSTLRRFHRRLERFGNSRTESRQSRFRQSAQMRLVSLKFQHAVMYDAHHALHVVLIG